MTCGSISWLGAKGLYAKRAVESLSRSSGRGPRTNRCGPSVKPQMTVRSKLWSPSSAFRSLPGEPCPEAWSASSRVREQLRPEPAARRRRHEQHATIPANVGPPGVGRGGEHDLLGAGEPDIVKHPNERILGEPDGQLVVDGGGGRHVLHVASGPRRELSEEAAFVLATVERERLHRRQLGAPVLLDRLR